jgi:hypothetical protein
MAVMVERGSESVILARGRAVRIVPVAVAAEAAVLAPVPGLARRVEQLRDACAHLLRVLEA